jgi:hypothetical protein
VCERKNKCGKRQSEIKMRRGREVANGCSAGNQEKHTMK